MSASIVVPLDGSAFGKRALPVALALARRNQAAVRLVHVHPEPPVASYAGGGPTYDPRLSEELRRVMRTDLTTLAEQLVLETSLSVDAEFLDGPVVPMLERYLAETSPGFVVMMTHGRGGLRRAWLGSVADGMVRHSPVPVLLVRSGAEWPGNLIEPLFRSALVPLDGSAMAEEVLDHVMRLGTPDATAYTLLTVVVPPLAPTSESTPDLSNVERQHNAALAYLSTVAEKRRQKGALMEVRVVVHPRAAEGILEEAEAQQADLIALSTRGRGAASRLLLGSVADKVIRGATVPVLVYHPAGGNLMEHSP